MDNNKAILKNEIKLHIVNYSRGKEIVDSSELRVEVRNNFIRPTADSMIYQVIREMENARLFSFIRMKHNTRIYLVNF